MPQSIDMRKVTNGARKTICLGWLRSSTSVRWTRWSMAPATCMAATVQITETMIPMTAHGMSSVTTSAPLRARTRTPAAPASPMPMPPRRAPMTMNARTTRRWNQITGELPWTGGWGAPSGRERGSGLMYTRGVRGGRRASGTSANPTCDRRHIFLVALAGDRSEFPPPSFWTVARAPVVGLPPAGWRGRPRARHHLEHTFCPDAPRARMTDVTVLPSTRRCRCRMQGATHLR